VVSCALTRSKAGREATGAGKAASELLVRVLAQGPTDGGAIWRCCCGLALQPSGVGAIGSGATMLERFVLIVVRLASCRWSCSEKDGARLGTRRDGSREYKHNDDKMQN
jgi:hypothetical protein